MKYLFLAAAIASVSLASFAATAQDAAPLATPALEPAANTATPAMWRVTDEDSEYILLGTFHFLPADLNWRTDALAAALTHADTVYFEMDPDDPIQLEKAAKLFESEGRNPSGVGLSAMLDLAEKQKLLAICEGLGINYFDIEQLRPWSAFFSLSVGLIISKGFQPGAGLDRILINEVKASDKDIRYFETMEEQVKIFTGLDAKTERNLLVITIRDWDEQVASFDGFFNAWASGDTNTVDEQMNDAMRAEAPEVYQSLIVNRNLAWAEELDAALKNEAGKGLVAVGAGHLVGGEFSVPALLAAKGYEVTPYGEWAETTATAGDPPANDNEPPAEE